MEFKDKYTSATEKEAEKKIISDDAFALGDMLQELINKLEHVRMSFIK